MRKRSARGNQRLKEYRKFRADLMASRSPQCAYPGCTCRRVDLHHTRGRLGALLTDERYVVFLCRTHHQWVGDNPAAARKLELLCELGKWGEHEAQEARA